MPAAAPQPTQNRWCDVDGSHLALFCRVEQIAETTKPSALPSRLHQQGQVLGRGLDSVYVCFEDHVLVSLSPHLLRLLPDTPGV
jgi:hypothetical protein